MWSLGSFTAVSFFFVSFLTFSTQSFAAPPAGNITTDFFANATCINPIKRKEWRTLLPQEKKDYIDAVLCLQKRPSGMKSSIPGALTRFDDFQGVHILQMENVHLNGQFLPWHRYFTAVYESALSGSCGYKGAQPYWDWTLDVKEGSVWTNSPVFSSVDGFGGNGPYVSCSDQPFEAFCVPNGTGGGCITDGPFRNLTLRLGPGQNIQRNDHCLRRNFHIQFIQYWFSETEVNETLNESTYVKFWRRLEGMFEVRQIGLHGAGHVGVGGTMSDVYSSPGDPLFYLHHANLDRLWWLWQKRNPGERFMDVSGPDSQGPDAKSVTLQYEIDMGRLARKVSINDVMRINERALCYDYA